MTKAEHPTLPIASDAIGHCSGLSAIEHAALFLKVPESGAPWLDDMIRKSQRNELAARAMQSYLNGADRDSFTSDEWAMASYQMADAMIKEGEKP